jgi:uncharacterized membrane protein
MRLVVAVALLITSFPAWADRFGILESDSFLSGDGLNWSSLIGMIVGIFIARLHEGDWQLYIIYGFIGLGAGSLVAKIF